MPPGSVNIDKKALKDLLKVKNEFDAIVESLQLIDDPDFMKSYAEAKKQIKKRDFVDWNGL